MRLILFLILIKYLNACSLYKRDTRINLLNNGYENVLIAINENVKENLNLINEIKNVFNEASQVLFNITRRRAYFKEIYILIPHTWNFKNNDEIETIKLASWQSYDQADICIESRKPPTTNAPYVLNIGNECGQPALYMHLTPHYILNKDESIRSYGSYGNVLVHEWAHLRYGVFDEHVSSRDESGFYFNKDNEIDSIRCSVNSLAGTLRDPYSPNGTCLSYLPNGLPDPECIFEDNFSAKKNIASLMYSSFLPQTSVFCDDDLTNPSIVHNILAPNAQNKYCKGKSIWEVLREHDDFNYGKNVPNLNEDVNILPIFHFVKQRNKRIVLIIDKSKTFETLDRYLMLKRAITDYVNLMVKDGDSVGVIHFDVLSKVVLSMTQIINTETRNLVIEKAVPTSFMPKTSNFWSALSLGVIMLKNHGMDTTEGGQLVLLTDAKLDPKYPNRKSVFLMLKSNGVSVDTIGINADADPTLELLAANTNGFSFRVSDTHKNHDLFSALSYISNRDLNPSNRLDILHTDQTTVSWISTKTYQLHIDETIANRKNRVTSFRFTFDYSANIANIKIQEPNTKRTYSLHETENCHLRFIYVNNAELICDFREPLSGLWTVDISNPFFEDINVQSRVISYQDVNQIRNDNSYIKVEAMWKSQIVQYPQVQILYVQLSKHSRPILYAQIHASILKPNGDTELLELYDNGLNADSNKNDGIYSRYFLDYSSDGAYSAQISVYTNGSSSIHKYKISGVQNPGLLYPSLNLYAPIDDESVESIEIFQRYITLGTFILYDYDTSTSDLTKPSMISDLTILDVNLKHKQIKLVFTAPGDDADLGSADKYEIMVSSDPIGLLIANNSDYTLPPGMKTKFLTFTILNATFDYKPNVCGTKETFVLQLKDIELIGVKAVSIKIRAIDAAGNQAEWSQICTTKMIKNTEIANGVQPFFKLNPMKLALKSSKEEFNRLERDKRVYFILLVVFLILIVIFLIGIMFIGIILHGRPRKPKYIERL